MTILGCGSSGKAVGGPGSDGATAAPQILTEPTNDSVPMGLEPVFNVNATGGALRYQWSKNGQVVAGMTSTAATYDGPATQFTDSGSVYTVTISNSYGSVVSSPATLTVTARAPKSGDLRFQQVDALSTVNGYGLGDTGNCNLLSPDPGGSCTFLEAVGTPFFIGTNSCGSASGGCVWQLATWNLPKGVAGVSVGYYQNLRSEFQNYLTGANDLPNLATADTVITNLNFSADGGLSGGGQPVFGLAYAKSDGTGGFDLAQHTVSPDGLQSAIAQEGSLGRVVTAVTFDGDDVTYLSYGWTGNDNATYETQTATASLNTVSTAVSNLAAQGYILTAIGGNDTVGVLLVGTRLAGDTMARPISITPSAQGPIEGYAIVGVVYPLNPAGTSYIFSDSIAER